MSLNWQFTDAERFKEIKGDPMNDAFIWGTMFVGIGEITEANAEEWWMRYNFADMVNGPFNQRRVNGVSEPYYITLEDTKKRIGLKTNVFPKKTDSQFLKNVFAIFKQDKAREIKEQSKTVKLEVAS